MLVPAPEAQQRIDRLNAESKRLIDTIAWYRQRLADMERKREVVRAARLDIYRTCERVEKA